MHHDFFAWVRLILLIALIAAVALWCSTTETEVSMEQPEQKEPVQIAQVTHQPLAVIPLSAEVAPEPTSDTTIEETTPPTEAETIPTEPLTEPETEPAETEPTYTDEELEMLALVIYQEAGSDSCSDETRLMVGTVVMNRVADPRFPDTMYEVLTAKRQYGMLHWTGIVWPDRANHPTEAAAVERAYAIAERILLGERTLPEDVVWQAEFRQGTEVVAYSDGIYFCR